MAFFCSVLALSVVALLSCSSSFASSSPNVRVSAISAAPSFMPDPALLSPSSPALSPDVSPLFPSPKAETPPPSDSSLPIIPSSPSPPNPDAIAIHAPDLAFPPSESPPPSSVALQNACGFLGFAVFLGLFVVCHA